MKVVYEAHRPPQDPEDPLVGTTIVEERSGFTGTETDATWDEGSGGGTGGGTSGGRPIDLPKSRPDAGIAPRVPQGLSTVAPAATAARSREGAESSPVPSASRTFDPIGDTADEPPAKSGGGALKILAVLAVLGVLGVLVIGGGLFFLGRGGGTTDVPVASDPPKENLPTGSPDADWATNGDGKGGVLLSIPEKAVEVNINNSTDFKSDWDGVGFLRLKDLAGGTYRTRVKMAAGGPAVRADFSVTPGKTCMFKLDAGAQKWQQGECR